MTKEYSHANPAISPNSLSVVSKDGVIRLTQKKSKPSEPKNKDSIGFVLWQILGGENANITKAAGRLKVRISYLNATIHGEQGISQRIISKKEWRKIFAEYYSDRWQKHHDDFEQRAKALIVKAGYVPREPVNKDSFGFVLWQILGGENVNLNEAARNLNVHHWCLTIS